MGWPRRNDSMRIYADRKEKGAYFLIFVEPEQWRYGIHPAIANVYPGPEPSLVYTNVPRSYIDETWAKRVSWNDLPPEWKAAFREYLSRGEHEPFNPARVRGLWRIGEQPPHPDRWQDGGSLAGSGPGVIRREPA
jgi:hypothetical protein